MSFEYDQALLEAALEGYACQLSRLEEKIAQVQAVTSGGRPVATMDGANAAPAGRARKSRVVSEEARQRMAESQKRRWAKARAEASESDE